MDRKSLPYNCSAFMWRLLWLLLTLGLWPDNSPHDLWQEVFNTRECVSQYIFHKVTFLRTKYPFKL